MIRAYIRSDDYEHEAHFDAEPWFRQASDEEIQALANIEWRGDYPADDVGWWMRDKDREVDMVLVAVEDERLGFEVIVDPDDAERWVKKNRPKLPVSNPTKKTYDVFQPVGQFGLEFIETFTNIEDAKKVARKKHGVVLEWDDPDDIPPDIDLSLYPPVADYREKLPNPSSAAPSAKKLKAKLLR